MRRAVDCAREPEPTRRAPLGDRTGGARSVAGTEPYRIFGVDVEARQQWWPMARFFFHLDRSQYVRDGQGEDCATVEDALRLGKIVAAQLARNSRPGGRILIEDGRGRIIFEVPLDECGYDLLPPKANSRFKRRGPRVD